MRRLLVTTFLTLDGVMQAPGGPGEDDSGGFTHGGWSANYWDDLMGTAMGEIMGKPFDLVLGRRTYEIFKGFWPTAPEEAGGKPLNDATKYVASRGTPVLDWGPAVHLEGDVAEAIAALKRGDGPELQVHGSGDLIQTLLRHNLVDEFHLWLFPVVVGTRQEAVRRRRGAGRPQAHRHEGLDDRRRHRNLRAGGRAGDRVGRRVGTCRSCSPSRRHSSRTHGVVGSASRSGSWSRRFCSWRR